MSLQVTSLKWKVQCLILSSQIYQSTACIRGPIHVHSELTYYAFLLYKLIIKELLALKMMRRGMGGLSFFLFMVIFISVSGIKGHKHIMLHA